MADNGMTLAEFLARPVMPEEYEKLESPIMPHLRAFGAGVADPMGLPSWLVNVLARQAPTYSPVSPQALDWYQRRMQEARNESPIAAGMGSALPLTASGLGIMRTLGELTTREAMDLAPWALGNVLGGFGGHLRESIAPPPRKVRPQGAYPPGGAY